MRAALAASPELRGVCVANDTLALGALVAIEEAGRTGQIVVTGFDAAPEHGTIKQHPALRHPVLE